MFERYKMTVTPLGPIHPGSGETISPGEYFLLPEEKDCLVYVVNLGSIPEEELGELRSRLLSMIMDNPVSWVKDVLGFPKMVELIRKHALFKCRTISRVQNSIQERWGKGGSELNISLLHRSAKGVFIPGSSIKGALRTALVWKRADKPIFVKDYHGNAVSQWERKQLCKGHHIEGRIEEDLLRHLKVSDASTSATTYVLKPDHIGMSPDAAADLQDYKECLAGEKPEKPYKLSGILTLETELLQRRRMSQLLSADDILDACRDFYNTVLDEEKLYWEDGDTREDEKALNYCEEIQKLGASEPNAALIRLGWGCGMNSVSMNISKEDNPHPQEKVDLRYYYNPQTRILIAGMPPGWALLKLEAM